MPQTPYQYEDESPPSPDYYYAHAFPTPERTGSDYQDVNWYLLRCLNLDTLTRVLRETFRGSSSSPRFTKIVSKNAAIRLSQSPVTHVFHTVEGDGYLTQNYSGFTFD